MKRLLTLLTLLLLCACSVQIYDLQPIIVGTNTPLPTVPVLRTASFNPTQLPDGNGATSTPPVHIAPTSILSAVSVNLNEIAMVDGGTGWAVGQIPGNVDQIILRTTDGGSSWKNVTPPQILYDFGGSEAEVAACFRDADYAWILYRSDGAVDKVNGIKLWYTRDGGEKWESANLPLNGYTIQYFSGVKIGFADQQTGWIFARVGQSEGREFIALYTTHDGGASWSAKVTSDSENLTSAGHKVGALFRDTLEGWISGESTVNEPGAVLWHTSDGGNSWYTQTLPSPTGDDIPNGLLTDSGYICSLSTPKFVDLQRNCAYAVLSCSGRELTEPISILYWTYDAFSTWHTYKLPKGNGNLTFYGITYGWYSTTADEGSDLPYAIYFTEDSGEHWREIAHPAWDSRLQFITEAVGFGIVTYNGQNAFVKSVNSGFSWAQIFPMAVP